MESDHRPRAEQQRSGGGGELLLGVLPAEKNTKTKKNDRKCEDDDSVEPKLAEKLQQLTFYLQRC